MFGTQEVEDETDMTDERAFVVVRCVSDGVHGQASSCLDSVEKALAGCVWRRWLRFT
jgi:hypothetical protein